jgi:hypothetical protein
MTYGRLSECWPVLGKLRHGIDDLVVVIYQKPQPGVHLELDFLGVPRDWSGQGVVYRALQVEGSG